MPRYYDYPEEPITTGYRLHPSEIQTVGSALAYYRQTLELEAISLPRESDATYTHRLDELDEVVKDVRGERMIPDDLLALFLVKSALETVILDKQSYDVGGLSLCEYTDDSGANELQQLAENSLEIMSRIQID